MLCNKNLCFSKYENHPTIIKIMKTIMNFYCQTYIEWDNLDKKYRLHKSIRNTDDINIGSI